MTLVQTNYVPAEKRSGRILRSCWCSLSELLPRAQRSREQVIFHFPCFNQADYASRCDCCKLLTLLAVFVDILFSQTQFCRQAPNGWKTLVPPSPDCCSQPAPLPPEAQKQLFPHHEAEPCNHPHISNQSNWSPSSPSFNDSERKRRQEADAKHHQQR